jgi:periplasmic copper chaperone A
MRPVAVAVLATTLVACASSAGAGSPSQSPAGTGIVVQGTWASAAGPHSALVYFGLSNRGNQDDVLLGATSEVGGRALIQTASHGGQTGPIHRLKLAAGGDLEFAPGSYDVELAGVDQTVRSGTVVRLALRFELAGRVEVSAGVR